MWIRTGSDEVVSRIERRIATITQLPVSHQEDMQVLRYEISQKYGGHYDINDSPQRKQQMKAKGVLGGLRVATCLMYLSDVEAGGETAFPKGHWLDSTVQAAVQNFSECAAEGVAIKPHKGDAILFFSLHPDGRTKNIFSFHTGCPVLQGIKFSATKWIHQEPFGHGPPNPHLLHRQRIREQLQKQQQQRQQQHEQQEEEQQQLEQQEHQPSCPGECTDTECSCADGGGGN